MKRYHLFEFHELHYFPAIWRNLVTEFLSFFASRCKPYRVIAERLWDGIEVSDSEKIVDLCSGAAQPIVSVNHEISNTKRSIPILLSDKFPNNKAFAAAEKMAGCAVTAIYEPIEATNVPPKMAGFRTIFTAFHHFNEEEARKVIGDAMHKKQGIGIFEYTERSLAWLAVSPFIPLFVLCCTPFVQPLTWQRVIFTYVIPVIPLFLFFDGMVSCLRTYSPRELKNLVRNVEAEIQSNDYTWEIGQVPTLYVLRVTYLIGYPLKREKPMHNGAPPTSK